jgi:amidase
MRRAIGVASIGLLALVALVAAAWFSGLLDRVLIELLVRQRQAQNLSRQLRTPDDYSGRRPLDFSRFDAALATASEAREHELEALLTRATIPDVQGLFERGALTAEDLTLYYVGRIRAFDGRLQSVTELNPEALPIARRLDAERRQGAVHGSLHGIPVLLKDNIATGDELHTTVGARALETARARSDASLVEHLRKAGAVILGKTALSEWANFMSPKLPNGFSSVGGQVRNPYGDFDVSGSSSGSAVAVAAGLVTVAVGTETWGSLIAPASQNGIVSIKPSAGVVKSRGILPLVDSWDTAGPMARNVTDAAILLDVLAGGGSSGMFRRAALDPDGLRNRRIGVVRLRHEVVEGDGSMLAAAIAILREAGAEVVPLSPISLLAMRHEERDFFELARHDFKRGVNAFLRTLDAPVRSLSDVIAFNAADANDRAPFGQETLIEAQQSETSDAEYVGLLKRIRDRARRAIDGMLDYDVELLVAVGDPFYVHYCAAGYPAISVPAGRRASGEPVGLAFIGRLGDDATLIRAAFAFEQIARARRAPELQAAREG